jgi:hypothetical protein
MEFEQVDVLELTEPELEDVADDEEEAPLACEL